jgi:hypothetical protein
MKLFAPAKFNQTINHLRQTILLPQEFALLVSNLAYGYVLPPFSWDNRRSLELNALSLGKKDLENCLIALTQDPEPELKQMFLRILAVRMSPGLSRLIWALLQYFYLQPSLREAAALAAASPTCGEKMLQMLFRQEQDIIPAAVEVLRQEEGDLAQFIFCYNLIEHSPLSVAIIRNYFQQTGERGFLLNEEFFLETITVSSEAEIKPCLINYLTQPWQFYSSRKINRALLNRFGLPAEGTLTVWTEIDPELTARYKQWIFIEVMEDYFGLKSKKLAVFGNFYKDIQEIRFFSDGKIMILDFGQFGIADLQNMPEHSYLMEKTVLEREKAILADEGEPRWLHERLAVEARDVIIEEKSSDILILNIFEIGKLYVQELLAELLRKEEGLWPVRFKHSIARFKEKAD